MKMIYEWLYDTLHDWGDEESSFIVAFVSQDTQAILGHPFAPNHYMFVSRCLVTWPTSVHCMSVQADKVVWVRA